MNTQLIILGNGFDLHCGLKSKYVDFFNSTIIDPYTAHSKFPKMRSDCAGFWETLLFYNYLEYRSTDYNWCDIETIIKETLWRIYYGDKQTSINIWKNAFESAKLNRSTDKEIEKFNSQTLKYLYKYCMLFSYKILARRETPTEEETIHLLIKKLLRELQNFEKRFCKYIKYNIVRDKKEFDNKYVINAVNLLAKITGFSHTTFENIRSIKYQRTVQVSEQVDSSTQFFSCKDKYFLTKEFPNLKDAHILSFNYTALFDILEVDSPCVYNNVHGKLCSVNCQENCNSSSIIFGIDDKLIQSQSTNTELRIFSKTYRKMFATSAPISVLPPNNGSPIDIKFYGHSLSEADYSYFQSIFDYYNLYNNSQVSLIFYYSKGHGQTDAIYRLINSYGKTLSNQEQGKNLIHKLLLENRLKIVELS